MSRYTRQLFAHSLAVIIATGCKVKDPLYCEDDSYCAGVAGRPYCDVNGLYPESEDIKKTCIASPFDAMTPPDSLTDGPPDMALLRMTPDAWTFPSIDRGASGSIETFIVENRGGVMSGPISATLTGPDLASFTILDGETSDCGTHAVPGNTSCFVRVQFAPVGAGGAKSATLDVKGLPGGELMSTLSAEVHDCQPSTSICSASNAAIVCDGHGVIVKETPCGVLGCDGVAGQCWDVDPSNGLGPQLDLTVSAPPLALTAFGVIDTDAGTIRDFNGQLVPVSTTKVAQAGGPDIRVFRVSSMSVVGMGVKGSLPLAIVSNGAISIGATFDVSARTGADATAPGAGSLGNSNLCAGKPTTGRNGAGGAGRATVGGNGGNATDSHGALYLTPAGIPLVGGCSGGDTASAGVGGYGGGAVQFVSRVSITISGASGAIDVSGGGGGAIAPPGGGAGGGSGGVVLLEAPSVGIGGLGIASRGGGGGGAGGTPSGGNDGGILGIGTGGSGSEHGGNGADTKWDPAIGNSGGTPGDGGLVPFGDCGGGGGSAGFLRVNNQAGSIQFSGSAVVYAFGQVGTVGKRHVP